MGLCRGTSPLPDRHSLLLRWQEPPSVLAEDRLRWISPTLLRFTRRELTEGEFIRILRIEIFEDGAGAYVEDAETFWSAVNDLARCSSFEKFRAQGRGDDHRVAIDAAVARHDDLLRCRAPSERTNQARTRAARPQRLIDRVDQQRRLDRNCLQCPLQRAELALTPSSIDHYLAILRYLGKYALRLRTQDRQGTPEHQTIFNRDLHRGLSIEGRYGLGKRQPWP